MSVRLYVCCVSTASQLKRLTPLNLFTPNLHKIWALEAMLTMFENLPLIWPKYPLKISFKLLREIYFMGFKLV